MAERFDRIWHNARLATVRGDLADLGVIERGVIAMQDGRIAFAGAQSDLPGKCRCGRSGSIAKGAGSRPA